MDLNLQGFKSPKNVKRYTVLNAVQTLSNASSYPISPQLYTAILQPRTGDTINPKFPMSVVIDRGGLSVKQIVRLYISHDGGILWDDIGVFDGISAIHYNYPESLKGKLLQLKITNLASDTIYASTGIFTIMGTGTKSIYSVTTSGPTDLWVDSTYLIYWDYNGDVADIVDVEMSVDQKTWKSVASGIPLISGKAGYPWYVSGSSNPTVYIRVKSRDGIVGMSRQFTILSTSAVGNIEKNDLALEQNYPNPFHSSTRIPYILSHSEEVTILAHDLLGNEVMRIRSNDYEQAGTHEAIIDAESLKSGTYIISLITTDKTLQRKIILQK